MRSYDTKVSPSKSFFKKLTKVSISVTFVSGKGRVMKRSGTLLKRGKYYHARFIIEGLTFTKPLNTASEKDAQSELERLMLHRQGSLDQYESFLKAELDRIRQHKTGENCVQSLISASWEAFISSPKRPKASRLTLSHYQSAWNQFAAGLPAERKHIGQITAEDATDRMEAIYKDGLSQSTANKHLIYLTAILNALLPEGAKNPFDGVIARGSSKSDDLSYVPLKAEQITALIAATSRQKGMKTTDEDHFELYGIFVTLAYTGLRLGDACGLMIEEVHFDRKVLLVRANKTSHRKKGKAAYAKIGLHPVLEAVLREQIGQRTEGPVFRRVGCWTSERQSSNAQLIFQRAGVERRAETACGMRNLYGTSSFRHTLEDRLRNNGVHQTAINVILCHADRSMAAAYSTISDEEVYNAISSAYPDLRPGAGGNVIEFTKQRAG